MNDIFSVTESQKIYKVLTLPSMGILTRKGVPFVAGSRFTQLEINRGEIKYTNTVALADGVDAADDSFTFGIWSPTLGIVKAADYSPCMPTQVFPTPNDGVFTFAIKINRSYTPNGTFNPSYVFEESSSFVITPSIFSAGDPNIPIGDVVLTVSGYVNGYFTLRGQITDTFSSGDILQGQVKYTNTNIGNGVETINVVACSLQSKCVSFSFTWTIAPRFKHTGDNVLYAKMGTVFSWVFASSETATVWELIGGDLTPPGNAASPDSNIVEWSSYSLTSDLASNDPNRGAGYDKLVEYQNIREKVLWGGGLPDDVGMSSVGFLGTAFRLPLSVVGSQPWKLPKVPGVYDFSLKATSATTGETSTRKYKLIVNATGLNGSGLPSESIDL